MPADDALLERLDAARRGGAALFALHAGDRPLQDLAHEALALDPGIDTATHVLAAGEPRRRRLGLRRR